MGTRARGLGLVVTSLLLVVACGGGGPAGSAKATEPAKASLPPDLPVVSCVGDGPFRTTPCGSYIETIYAQVAANGPFSEVRATTVGVADCTDPREFPSETGKPKNWFWMIRFNKDGTDYGGFVGTGGKLGVICTPFTGQ